MGRKHNKKFVDKSHKTKNEREQVERNESFETIPRQQSKNVFCQLIDFNTNEQENIELFDFAYNTKDLFKMRLVKLIPPKDEELELDLKHQLLKGTHMKCLKYIEFVKAELQDYKLQKLEDDRTLDIELLQIQLENKCQVFGPRSIEIALDDLQNKFGIQSDKVNQLRNGLIGKKISYLFWIPTKQMEKISGVITTLLERMDKVERQQTVQTKYSLPLKQTQQKRRGNPSNTGRYSNKRNSSEKQIQSNEDYKVQEYQTRVRERRSLFKALYSSRYFDEVHIKGWLNHSRAFIANDIQIKPVGGTQENPDSYSVELTSYQQKKTSEQKLNKLMIYLQYQKLVLITQRHESAAKMMLSKYPKCKQLTIQLIKGYKNSSTNLQSLRWMIHDGKVFRRRSQYNDQPFIVLRLKGLWNIVHKYASIIQQQLQNMPMEDITEQIYPHCDKIRPYLRQDKRVQKVVRKVVTQSAEKHKDIFSVHEILFPIGSIKIEVMVKCDKQEDFKTLKKILQKDMLDNICLQQLTTDKFNESTINELSKDKRFLIVNSGKKWILIETKDEIYRTINKIHEHEKMAIVVEEKYLETDTKAIAHAAVDFLQQLKKANQKDFAQVKYHLSQNVGQRQFKLTLIGPQCLITPMINQIALELVEQKKKIVHHRQTMSYRQACLIRENKNLQQKIFQNFKITLDVSQTSKLAAVITIESAEKQIIRKNIIIKQNVELDVIPVGAVVVFRSQEDLERFKQSYLEIFVLNAKKHQMGYSVKDSTRGWSLLYLPDMNIQSIIEEANKHLKEINTIALQMPNNRKEEFVEQIINLFAKARFLSSLELTIIILEQNMRANVENIVRIKENRINAGKLRIYYTLDNTNKFYYSASGNSKINNAITAKQKKLILCNEDLNIKHVSHRCNKNFQKITHLQSGKSFDITITAKEISFILNGQVQKFPDSQFQLVVADPSNEVNISLGFYELDLVDNVQRNLFSGYERDLLQDEEKMQEPFDEIVKVAYNQNICEIIYSFLSNKVCPLQAALDTIRGELRKSEVTEIINLTPQLCKKYSFQIQAHAIEYELKCEIDGVNGILTVKSYDPRGISFLKKYLTVLEKGGTEIMITYPEYWQEQIEEIKTFTVAKTSAQFQQVQLEFRISTIKELLRIQNRIVYKKYANELQSLKQLNNGVVPKRMRLFHGTKTTNPELIYADKEESFNINYSRATNLLGIGVYFAQQAAYSNGYCHKADGFRSMFLCEVITGDSEKCPMHAGDIRDTSYKDPVNKIKYESMTDYLEGSHIYVVYKSRRAYPLYLIKY